MSYEEIITTAVQTYKAGVECCPFCGSHKVVLEEHSSPGSFEWYQVRCYMCEARAGIASDPEEAMKNWNTREGKRT